MSVVVINAITVPTDRAEEFEARFASRAGEVSSMPGFEAFELMKPTDGRDVFLVYTRWESAEAFQNWMSSPAFQHGHRQHDAQGPVGSASEVWMFDVIQREEGA
ncbi:MAG: antibiotic biosynthesis monooxygenase [Actinobacteria bacterium]|nr:antibiotic biosynthesis monooxygenase [Actinomycetota bacterium]